MLVHQLNPTDVEPAERPAGDREGRHRPRRLCHRAVTVPDHHATPGATIPLTTPAAPGSTEQLVAGSFIDLTQDTDPGAPTVITCTGVTAPAR